MTDYRPPRNDSTPLRIGVIGVGSMGENHARVYAELRDVELAGVTDQNRDLAREVAHRYGTEARSFEELLSACDAVTVAVPTHAHEEVVSACLDAGVHVLVEKPIADSVEAARRLAERAQQAGLVLQVGHIERFNPAVGALGDLLDDHEIIAVDANRLGPPVDREGTDGVVADLMVHDVDIVGSIFGGRPDEITASAAEDGQYATATMRFDDVVASLTASRVTQKKVRKLTVTTTECLIEVDYLEQSVLIHRDSYPSYVTDDGTNRYRHESVVERPRIDNGEPLRHELESFVEAVKTGSEPVVTAEDGIRALQTITRIERRVGADEVVVQ
ncbi:Gfo/Idh/MocA family oxidoreductase [Halobacteria archaeon AArc-dxtr1]|nr:Gfo/Idh/MocA family oxidoreductase [Halobacteria archaeon AArc-dxtr1]